MGIAKTDAVTNTDPDTELWYQLVDHVRSVSMAFTTHRDFTRTPTGTLEEFQFYLTQF